MKPILQSDLQNGGNYPDKTFNELITVQRG